MSATKPEDIALTLQNATEGFIAIVDQPTYTHIINIRELLLLVLIQTKYNDITLRHNLPGVIFIMDKYEHIYRKGAYSISPVVALYDESINKDATRTEVHQAEVKHEAYLKNCALYYASELECKICIVEVVNKTWYKSLEDPDTFYMSVTALKTLNHLTKFCSGLHAVDAVNIPQLMETIFANADVIPQFINVMEAAQINSKRAKLEVQDKYMHVVALKSLLKQGE